MKKKKPYKGPGSGIMAQIENSDNIKYNKFSKKDLEDLMIDLMANMPEEEMNAIAYIKPNTRNLTVEGQIKEGYLYRMGSGNFSAVTGYEGIWKYVDTLRESGISETEILNEIKVLDTDGIRTDTKCIPLIDVEWKEISNNQIK